MQYRCVSADSHINEPPDLWTSAAPASLRDSIPRVVQTADGDCWSAFPGAPLKSMKTAAAAGRDYRDYGKPLTYKEMRPGSYDPVAHLEDMSTDGVDADVLYPGVGLMLARLPTPEIRRFCAQAYNDWMANFCNKAPERLIGLAILPPIEDGEATIDELKRAVKLGLRGAWLAQSPEGAPLSLPAGQKFWASAEEAGMPISLHIGAGAYGITGAEKSGVPGVTETVLATRGLLMAEHLGVLVFSGILSRHPRLRIVIAESGAGWLPYFVERMDSVFERHRHHMKTGLAEPPSEVVRRAVFATFMEETSGIMNRRIIGNNLMWANDYPHTDTTWPHSQSVIKRLFGDLPEEDRRQIIVGNAARLYSLVGS